MPRRLAVAHWPIKGSISPAAELPCSCSRVGCVRGVNRIMRGSLGGGGRAVPALDDEGLAVGDEGRAKLLAEELHALVDLGGAGRGRGRGRVGASPSHTGWKLARSGQRWPGR